jgi:hypothetical protein
MVIAAVRDGEVVHEGHGDIPVTTTAGEKLNLV